MGYELAKLTTKRGANVTLISGPTNLTIPNVDKFVSVLSTQDMYNAVEEYFKN